MNRPVLQPLLEEVGGWFQPLINAFGEAGPLWPEWAPQPLEAIGAGGVVVLAVVGATVILRRLGGWIRGSMGHTSETTDMYELKEIALDQIVGNPYQPRTLIDPEKLEELTVSIRQHGVITPIQVIPIEDNQYQLVGGERRVRAARKAGLTTIPALIRELTDEQLIEVGFLDNLLREEMNPVDVMVMYNRLRTEFKSLSREELSDMIGKSPEEIARNEWMLDLPTVTQQAIKRGLIPEELAQEMCPLTERQQRDFLREVAQNNTSPERMMERIDRIRSTESPNGGDTSGKESPPGGAELQVPVPAEGEESTR